MEQLRIKTFGEFSLQAGENRVCAGDSRSRKIWVLLAYLISYGERTVSQSELIALIWGGETGSSNPENALKVTLHRARTLLDKLWPGAGHELILRRGEGYTWNREIPMELDAVRFEQLCRSASLEDQLAALALYRGEYLDKLSTGTWVIPISAHYHSLYLQTLLAVIPALEARQDYARIADLCQAALPIEPYHEELHRHLMGALLARQENKTAAAVYETLRDRLYRDFGLTPCEETRTLYRQAVNIISDIQLPMETVLESLLEQDPAAGALFCDLDCIKVICHAEARAMLLGGDATHLALMSVTGVPEKPLSKRSLDKAMDNLGEQIRLNLRRGDVIARCSTSQYVILLPQTDYENSCVICQRLIAAFCRRYPHSPIRINYMVRPLPNQSLEERH